MSGPAVNSPTSNYMVPASGGTHAVSYSDTLTASPTTYDFRQFQIDNFNFTPQGAYIDNSQNTQAAVFTFAPMGFKLSIPAGAFAAVNFPAPKGLIAQAVGAGPVPVIWVDYPVLPQIFYASAAPQVVNMPAVPNGATGYSMVQVPTPNFDPKQISIAAAATSGNVSPSVPNTNLRKLILEVSGDATLGAAAEIGITVTLNAVTIFAAKVAVGTVAGTGSLYARTLDFDAVAPNAGTGNLTVTLSGALTTGTVSANAYFD